MPLGHWGCTFFISDDQHDPDFLLNESPAHCPEGTHSCLFAADGALCCFCAQEVILGDLKADTSYSVSVGAYTAKGDGARSKPVTVCSALPRKCVYTDSANANTLSL